MDNAAATPLASVPGRPGAERPFVAIGFVLLAVAVFSVMDAASKILVADYDPVEVMWGRYLAILAMLVPLILRSPRALVVARPGLQLARGICIFGAAVFFITGLAILPIADATAISFVSPLLVTALSIPMLGERVGPRRWAAMAVGFLGVVVIIRPGSGAFGPAALLPLLSAACWAMSIVVTRRMRNHDRPLAMLFYSTMIGFVMSGAALPFVWRPPTAAALALMVLMGALSVVGQYLLIMALTRGAASLVAPFTYSQIIWSTLIGFFVFGTVPMLWTWCGAAIVVGSGIYVVHRERVTRRAAVSR